MSSAAARREERVLESSSPSNPTVLVLAGATASGKTSLSVALAKAWDAEIVSADSRQVYRYLDIGTAKPSPEERGGIAHFGFDVVDPDVAYSAGRFAREARGWIEQIHARGKRALVVGGSGLYLQALVEGFFVGEDAKDAEVRLELEEEADRGNLHVLYKELQSKDPVYAEITKPNDRQRILRALEVIRASGEPFSALHERDRDAAPFESRWFGLEWPREQLYQRVEQRVDQMLDRGLVREVDDLLDRGYRDANALKSVGYEELIDLREGRLKSLESAKELIVRNTRRYAKRQLTWFRGVQQLNWIDAARLQEELVEEMLADL